MNLAQKQRAFTLRISQLIAALYRAGYEVTLGEAWRPPETARLYAQGGKGIANSLHCSRLAIDLNLFKAGTFLTKTDDYKEAGELWEALSTPDAECVWGGTFGDGNHFSISHNGVR